MKKKTMVVSHPSGAAGVIHQWAREHGPFSPQEARQHLLSVNPDGARTFNRAMSTLCREGWICVGADGLFHVPPAPDGADVMVVDEVVSWASTLTRPVTVELLRAAWTLTEDDAVALLGRCRAEGVLVAVPGGWVCAERRGEFLRRRHGEPVVEAVEGCEVGWVELGGVDRSGHVVTWGRQDADRNVRVFCSCGRLDRWVSEVLVAASVAARHVAAARGGVKEMV